MLWGYTPFECQAYLKHRQGEVRFRQSVMAYMGVAEDGGDNAAGHRQNQEIGEYCQGRDLDECRKMFGEGLGRVCATCPG